MLWRMLVLLVAGTMILGGFGCKKASEKIAEKMIEQAIEKDGGKADVDLSGQKVSIQTKDGQKMEFAGNEKGIKMPTDFPKDVYVYEGATPMGSMKTPEGQTLTLTTADPLEKVAGQYKARMTAAGWKEKTSAVTSDMTMLDYVKDKQEVMVHASKEGEKTQIMLMVQTKKDADQ